MGKVLFRMRFDDASGSLAEPLSLLKRWRWWWGLLGLVLVVVVGFLGWRQGWLPSLEEVKAWIGALQAFLVRVPLPVYWLAFAFLPAFGVPLTLFYLTALPIMGVHGVGWGLLGAYTALGSNMAMAYALGRYGLRPWVEPLLHQRGWAIPQTTPAQQTKVILLTRLSPVPFAMQNFALSIAGFQFWRYLILSLLGQGLVGLGIMLLGEAFLAGGFQYAFPAVFLILLVWFGLPLLRQRLRRGEPSHA